MSLLALQRQRGESQGGRGCPVPKTRGPLRCSDPGLFPASVCVRTSPLAIQLQFADTRCWLMQCRKWPATLGPRARGQNDADLRSRTRQNLGGGGEGGIPTQDVDHQEVRTRLRPSPSDRTSATLRGCLALEIFSFGPKPMPASSPSPPPSPSLRPIHLSRDDPGPRLPPPPPPARRTKSCDCARSLSLMGDLQHLHEPGLSLLALLRCLFRPGPTRPDLPRRSSSLSAHTRSASA